MFRTFKYRIYPTRRQAEALEGQLAFACDLWNAALEQRITSYRLGHPVGRKEQQHQLTDARVDGPEMNYMTQEMVLQRLHLAFDAFFRRLKQGQTPGFPRFKPKHRFNTLSWRRGKGGAAIVDGRLRIQGVGHIKVKWHRDLLSEPRQTRITRRNGRWYAAFSVEVERQPLPATGQSVGIDVGVRTYATLSTGERIEGPRARRSGAPAVRRAQRKVARRQRGSHRRRKAIGLLARQREREANRRRDAAHKAARSVVSRFDVIAHEDLKTAQMVRGNRGLNREILDQGWGMFFQFLADKAENAGRQVLQVDPRFTSQTCAECGSVDAGNRKAKAFLCLACGHSDDADVNAARNILARAEPSGANENEEVPVV